MSPRISVVIPAFERVSALRSCLRCVEPSEQTLSADSYEVIVTDDSRTREVQKIIRREFPWVRWVQGPRRGPAANRNCGAKAAVGEWIAFTDDDCLPDRNWLLALCDAVDKEQADLLEGRTVCPDRTNAPMEETIENLQGGNFWTCNLAVRRRAFESLKGFDEDFEEAAQEDTEFAWRACARGLRSQFVEGALVRHPARQLTLAQLWRRALMVRWFSLYLLKTRSGWADQKLPLIYIRVCLERAANLLRQNRKVAANWRATGLSRACFLIGWSSLVFPVLLPYVLWWEYRFRKSLSAQNDRNFAPAVAPARS
jgi:GT2 family glycosyltransferase